MNEIKIGFAKTDITPPLGTELAGYAGYRPCTGIHDPLWCKAVVLEQPSGRYGLMVLDLMCVDETLYQHIAQAVAELGIRKEQLIVSAIHSHAAPRGGFPGEGPLDLVNHSDLVHGDTFRDYMDTVVAAAKAACVQAISHLASFRVQALRAPLPPIGSERHTGAVPNSEMTLLHIRTDSEKSLILYNFPCHPTVTNAANLMVSSDFTAGIESLLDADMAMFVNGAAGDISTRFTRRESSFAECTRMGAIAAAQIRKALEGQTFMTPEPLTGIHEIISLRPRAIETVEHAQKQLEETTARWKQAEAEGLDAATVRILKSYAEGAIVNLQFSQTMAGISQLNLPVSVFHFCGLNFVSIPGELFSTLQPENCSVIAYANGYYRYICGKDAYDAGYYEAIAAILARGEGEQLMAHIRKMLSRL